MQSYESLALRGKLLNFRPVYLFFLLFYVPPRLLFLLKNPGPSSVITFLLQTRYYVWSLLSRTVW
jgi:hypothetical protein